jgi:hypothetical protein
LAEGHQLTTVRTARTQRIKHESIGIRDQPNNKNTEVEGAYVMTKGTSAIKLTRRINDSATPRETE